MMHSNYGHWATIMCLTVGLALYFPAKVTARQSPPTNLSGNVSGALTLANSPYVVTGDITIPENASLTVEPGVAIKFGLGRNLFVRGTLIARGNAQNPIFFTSIRDDAPFGDTNGDGATTRPAPGDWGRLEFAASSGNSGLMEHCVTRYGGNFFAMIRSVNASPTIRQSVIDSSRFVAGLSMETGGNPVIEQNNFRGNLVAALYMQANVFPRFSGNTASGNGVNGILFPGGTITISGIWNAVDLPYVLSGDLSIGDMDVNTPPIDLTLRPGAVIKLNGRGIYVRDAFHAAGKPDSMIVFTAFTDDGYGGDTNNDGNATQPAPGQWSRIEFAASSGSSGILERCLIRYGGDFYAMIRVINASPSIRNCTIENSRFVAGLSMETGGNPVIEQNNFRGSPVAAIYMQANVFPRFSGNTASGNGVNGILFPGGTITISGIWNAVDLPYVLSGDLSIGDTDVNTPPIDLTLRPGAVIKLNGRGIYVRDAFHAAGKPDSMIVFTAFTDDGYGGDTNNDGNATQPAPGQWSRIEFAASSGSSGILERCLIRYGGDFYAMIRVINASPSIRNCTIENSRFVAGLSMETGGNPVIEQNNFRGNLVAALYMQANVFPRFSDNTASGNGVNGILFPGGTITISGIWNAVDLPYVLSGDLSIGDTDVNTPPIDLTLRPGAVIKLSGRGIYVRDTFRAAGKPDSLIVFTAFTDDRYGGDTNNNGSATQPAPGQWSRIEFAASSGSSGILERCLIRYGGDFYAMIRVIGASPTFNYCRIEQSRFAAGITMESGSRAALLRNVIVDNGFDGIGVSASAPTIENNTILRNGRDGIANAANAATSIKNNIIVNNSRYGIFCDAGSQLGTAISYNDVWNNSQANYQGCSAGVGDLSDDPQFIDAANGIFALLSRSPCVDAGDPKDFDPGTVSRVDLGAFPFSGVPGVPIRIVAVSGNAQNWYVDNPLLAPLVVEVTDAFVNGIAGVKVDFTITTGSGFLDTQTINTDANGRAQTQWRLGSEVGVQRVDVRAADFKGNLLAGAPVVFTAVADSLPPPPSVAFTADVTGGFTPLKVQFTSQTAGVFTALLWRFGDGDSSAIENPQHTYQDSGAYTVSLKAVGPGGEQRLVQENYIMARLRIFGSIAGRVIDYNGKEPVAGVRMRVTGTTMDDTTTNSQGNYSFASIRVGTNYVLKPERTGMFFQPPKIDFSIFNDDFKDQNFIASLYGDVSGNDEIQAFDASVLLRYLIGLLSLKDLPHDSIAADVSGNAGLSAFDASLILRFVAGLLERFPVEDSATAKIQAPAAPTANVRLATREPTTNTHFTTPILFESSEEIYAGDLSVSFDSQRLRFSGVATSEKFEKFFTVHAQHENEIRIALAGTQPVSGSGVLLLLDWEILGEAELGSAGASVLITRAVFNESPVQVINAPFENLPSAFYLWPNYPNPFNPQTQINYDLPTAVFVRLEIFNVLGQKVRTLVHEQKAAGSYKAVWDGRRDDGNLATSGIYIYRLRTKAYENSRTLLFLR